MRTVGLAAFLAGVALLLGAGASYATAPPDHKTTICHATGSASNPYVVITVDNASLNAHRQHQNGRDIIPAPAGATKHHPENCVSPSPSVSPTETPTNGVSSPAPAGTLSPTASSTTTTTVTTSTTTSGGVAGTTGSATSGGVLGESLAATGSTDWMVVLGLVLMAAGFVLGAAGTVVVRRWNQS